MGVLYSHYASYNGGLDSSIPTQKRRKQQRQRDIVQLSLDTSRGDQRCSIPEQSSAESGIGIRDRWRNNIYLVIRELA